MIRDPPNTTGLKLPCNDDFGSMPGPMCKGVNGMREGPG